MPPKERLTPTLFDKLVADINLSGLRSEGEPPELFREVMRYYSVPKLERFNETAMRATVRRDLAWLLNTTNLSATHDLADYPQVESSVLNFGVPDLAGKTLQRRTVLQRAREIRNAVRAFETRMAPDSVVVEPHYSDDRPNSVGFVIHGDISSAVAAMPVEFRTTLDTDTAAVEVSE